VSDAKEKDVSVQWDNLRCLYAEDLKGKRYTMKIGGIRDTPKGAKLFCHNEESDAWDIAFALRDKDGKTPYIQIPQPNSYGKRTTLLRQFVMATGCEPGDEAVGRDITLYPVESKKSTTGKAIRIAVPEHAA
jgi:hypothetical protein